MNSRLPGLFLGLSLVIIGIMVLLKNFYYLDFHSEALLSVFLFFGSVFFYIKYFSGNKNIIWLIIGSGLLIASFSVYAANSYDIRDDYIAVAALLITGTTFLVPYFQNRQSYLLLLPVGICYSVGIALFYQFYSFYPSGTSFVFILFLGFTVTFGIMFLLRNEKRNLGWAAFPAVIFLVLAAFFGLVDTIYFRFEGYLLPVVIIIIGLVLLVKSLINARANETENLPVKE
ncbi:hypothetical protein ACFL6G_09390 [candidate division KSB1 bacterium]